LQDRPDSAGSASSELTEGNNNFASGEDSHVGDQGREVELQL